MRYIPSNQRILYYQLRQLRPPELLALNAIARQGPGSIPVRLAPLSEERKIVLLESLMAYHQYRLVADGPHEKKGREELKDLLDTLKISLAVPTLQTPLSFADQ